MAALANPLFTPPAPAGDITTEPPYHFEPDGELVVAVNVALATGRPLLVCGSPGSGKSTLARAIARGLGRRRLSYVITGRTQARDLLYTFDAVRRLADAQAAGVKAMTDYVHEGVLWQAFASDEPCVVLLDEIDKADPDLPNSLLVPLEEGIFYVDELREHVQCKKTPFVVVTTNGERELPRAFVRRCVTTRLEEPSVERLVTIAELHGVPQPTPGLHERLAAWVVALRTERLPRGERFPSVAEYLDAVRAFAELGAELELDEEGKPTGLYASLLQVTLDKADHQDLP